MRSFFCFTALALVAALGVACAKGPSLVLSAPTGAPDLAQAQRQERFLVWTKESDGHATTYTLDAFGHVVATDEGIRIAARGASWAYRTRTRDVALQGCPEYDAQGNELPTRESTDPGKVLRATFERMDDGEQIEVVSEHGADGLAGLDESADLVATVGPYAFVKTTTYVFGCGAHGNTGVTAEIWDLERGTALFLNDRDKLAAYLSAPTVAALRERAESAFPGNEVFRDKDGKLNAELTELVPLYSGEGGLELKARFTVPACYACSDGEWSSYSQSTLEDLPEVPAAFRAYATPPPAVREFLRTHAAVTVSGWSSGAI